MELIREKIIAPNMTVSVARQRLLEQRVDHWPGYSVTVITGRAGTGKTTLAAAIAQSCGRRVAWYKVDAADANFTLFVQYLLASLGKERLPVSSVAYWLGLASRGRAAALAEALAENMLQLPDRSLLVLDDLHLLYDTPWLKPFLQRLMGLLGDETHLLMAARSLPPVPLWRLRAKQRLRVIDEAELLFTVPETEELFSSYGLSPTAVGEAWRRSCGRAARLDSLARHAQTALSQ